MFIRASLVVATLFVSGSILAVAQPEHQQSRESPSPAAQPAKAVNDRCPIKGEEVDSESPTRVWRGHTIGFCCPGCETKWDARTDGEKDAFLAKYVRVAPASPCVEVARRFQAAMTAGDVAAIDRLFLGNGKATVLENGSDEGTWERYRDEHLKPELKDLAGYQWRTATETESAIGTARLISQTGTFTIGEGKQRKAFFAAITFVVVDDGGAPKVAHMHWSSREIKADHK
ncbi:MAG: hypothetical protein IT438_16230 [Phycisphaerales bacterium]|nr:hypothetical protein [Phycisphaerales bacterium]